MHLFAGGGGGMYADLILGHTPTVAVEWEKAACDVLRARKEKWWPDCEIIEGDIRAFSGVRYAGKMDCIHAGFPCQDLSVAGNGAGLDGDRSSLYVEALRIYSEVRPRYLFLENVTGIFTANDGEALNRVASDLAALGLDARWLPIRASDVGANHRRDRWWCLAYPKRSERGPLHKVSDMEGQHRVQPEDRCEGASRAGKHGKAVADAHRTGRPQQWGPQPEGQEQPTSELRSWWSVEPPVGRVANGVAKRVNRLKMLGNGQVPLQAAYAWVMLGGPTEIA